MNHGVRLSRCISSRELLMTERTVVADRKETHEVQAKPSKVAANGVLPDGVSSSTSKKQETIDVIPSATISLEPNEPVTSKISNPNQAAKISATPPAMPAGANLAFVPDSYPVYPLLLRSRKLKSARMLIIVQCRLSLFHMIVGYVANRSQPVRYGGQYHRVQTTPTYVQPSSQNVMVGRLGPVFYVHPLPQSFAINFKISDVRFDAGTEAAQTLQLCATPPFIAAGGQAPFVLPSHIPISQPLYPVIRPISVMGSNGFLVSKYS
ncbi:hypothetical protein L6452_08810 [Arctium lappa]|uniref:Uncharacterized protein n=1 Tax=Arctium lappa TaxID=4217 RepID=A0ACB9DI97_ARCLA|nr:hypothetical protein L6452_08810 [Arctium lappa]